MDFIITYTVIINISGMLMMLCDKRRAVRGSVRIRERDLLIIAALGASVGILASMIFFRHKTRKILFTAGVPVMLILQTVAVMYIFR